MKPIIISLLLGFSLFRIVARGASEYRNGVSLPPPVDEITYEIQMTKYKREPTPDDAVMLRFYEDEFNVDIKLWNLDQSKYIELLNLRIASGDIPDLMYISGQAGIEQNLYEQGVFLPLDRDFLYEYAPHMMAMLDKEKPGWEKFCSSEDGTLYKLPDFDKHPNEQAVIWRGDWLKAVGIEKVPRTLDEFEAALYAFTREDPDGNGRDDSYGASLMVLQAVFGAFGDMPFWSFGYEKSFGNVWHEREGKLIYAAIQPEMKEALALLHKWYADGVIDPEFLTGENLGGYWAISHPFIYGRIGYTGHGALYHWMPSTYEGGDNGGANNKELMNIDPTIAENLVYGEPPIGPEGKRGVSGVSYVDKNKGTAFGAQLAEEPEKFIRILQILDWQYESIDNYLKASYGTEGEFYTTEEVVGYDGKTYTVISPTDKAVRNKDKYFIHGIRVFPALFDDEAADPTLQWKLEHHVGEEVYTNDLNRALPSETIYGAELERLTEETYYQIITGLKPISYFDEYVKKWHENGGDILYKEANP